MQVVIIGAGYAGLTTAMRLARSRYAGRVVLINDRPEHTLTTQLHKVAAGSLPPTMALLSLERLLQDTEVHLLVGQVTAIDPEQSRVTLDDGTTVGYDRLVVALGSRLETFDVPGVLEHALYVQPLEQALRVRDHIAARLAEAADWSTCHRETLLHFIIVGGGLTGVELAGELADQLPEAARKVGIEPAELTITLMEAGPRLLPGLAPSLADEAADVLARKGVVVKTNTTIKAVTATGVTLVHDPGFAAAGTVIWTAGVRGHQLTEATFVSGPRGRALVDNYLRAVDYPDVYILGDNALAVSRGNEQAAAPTAQNAVQQATTVVDNLIAETKAAGGIRVDGSETAVELTPYVARPLGIFVSIGHGEAVGELAFGDYWRPRLSGKTAYALKWASEQRYKLGIGVPTKTGRQRK